jgi:hypothetical protein
VNHPSGVGSSWPDKSGARRALHSLCFESTLVQPHFALEERSPVVVASNGIRIEDGDELSLGIPGVPHDTERRLAISRFKHERRVGEGRVFCGIRVRKRDADREFEHQVIAFPVPWGERNSAERRLIEHAKMLFYLQRRGRVEVTTELRSSEQSELAVVGQSLEIIWSWGLRSEWRPQQHDFDENLRREFVQRCRGWSLTRAGVARLVQYEVQRFGLRRCQWWTLRAPASAQKRQKSGIRQPPRNPPVPLQDHPPAKRARAPGNSQMIRGRLTAGPAWRKTSGGASPSPAESDVAGTTTAEAKRAQPLADRT